MDTLYAVIDPNWGEPLIIVETIRKTSDDAIAEVIKHPDHRLYASKGWDSMIPQGYYVSEVEVNFAGVESYA